LQWIKNLLIFAPLFFAGHFFTPQKLSETIFAVIIFSFVASFVYVLNDIFDKQKDSEHPIKCRRPIAASLITIKEAIAVELLLGVSILLSLILLPRLIPLVLLYILLNVGYSVWLKHVAVVDIVLVAVFYVFRIFVGGIAADVPVSSWIIMCTFFGALFIITSKRRAECELPIHRRVLDTYALKTLDFILLASMILSITSYGLYAILVHKMDSLAYSTVFVVIALFRFLNNLYTKTEKVETPETLVFKDFWILGAFLAWILTVLWVIY
jgi:4-hydroxybenzoate polyprenyltransferase